MGRRRRSPGQALIQDIWSEAGIDTAYITAVSRALSSKAASPSDELSLLTLPLLCCQAAGGTLEQGFELAAAWELFYAAAHVFDALADGAYKAAPEFGVALNVATGLTVGMGQALCHISDTTVVADVQQAFFTFTVKMCAGQHRALSRRELTLEECWRLAEDRSGTIFAAACRLGARLVSDDTEQLRCFEYFGYQIGILLQIGNELGGLWEKPGEVSDLVTGQRWTLPIAHAMATLTGEKRERLSVLLEAAPDDKVAEQAARHYIVESGSVLYLMFEARQRRQQAKRALVAASVASPFQEQLLVLLTKHASPYLGDYGM